MDSASFRANVYAELDVLRRRIFALEDMHERIARLEEAQDGSHPATVAAHARPQGDDSGNADSEGDAAVTLEFFALGTDRRNPNQRDDLQDNSRPATPVSCSPWSPWVD